MYSVALLTAAIVAAFATTTYATPLVATTQGLVRGYTTKAAHVYRGIPYAKPPVGDLRWRRPQRPAGWGQEVKFMNESSPGCPQIHCDHMTPAIACPKKTSEDCLYLDVYTPLEAKSGTDLPVMLFIHGGNFFFMSGSSLLFEGDNFSARGKVVLVNINYRLGALGFLVTGKHEDAATGNFGLLDQRMAMQWVKENIKSFGGDPSKVTLFGQSAGAQSILHHMTSTKSTSYFRSAILESDPVGLPYRTFDEAFYLGALLAKQLNCSVADVNCMRSKKVEDVTMAGWATRGKISTVKLLEMFEPYGPYVDGEEVKGQPVEVVRKGGLVDASKPVIMGTLSEETVLYIYSAFQKSVGLAEYLGIVAAFRPFESPLIVDKYPPTLKQKDQREALVNLSKDLVFTCPTRHVMRDIAKTGNNNTWLYLWNHAMSFPGWGHVSFCEGRVCHGSELVYVFDTAYEGNFTMTPDEQSMTYELINYWTNFAWAGDPNIQKPGQTLLKAPTAKLSNPVNWTPFGTASKFSMLKFETPSRELIRGYREEYCNFWDSIGYS